ncbi:MAG TPA: response regulator transcription factor [Vicinamibacteria bacterium]|nr:response regulator transcription factor [Vicinamibacteria bacterium]
MPSPEAGRLRVAVVEDDREMRELLREALGNEGYAVTAVGTGAAASEAVRGGDVDAVVLDVWLPDADGVELCRGWRRTGLRIPILMLTARTDVAARVAGLEAGADDYLGKPFALAELRARLTALLRRGARPLRGEVFRRGTVRVDFGRRQAWVGGQEVAITRRELEVLERLAEAGGRAVSRDDLLQDVWGEATRETAASLEVMVARLRRKLERPGGSPIVRTVRGYGYAVASGEEAE